MTESNMRSYLLSFSEAFLYLSRYLRMRSIGERPVIARQDHVGSSLRSIDGEYLAWVFLMKTTALVLVVVTLYDDYSYGSFFLLGMLGTLGKS